MTERVFITGAAGFVGATIVRTFAARGYEVHAAVRPAGTAWRLDEVTAGIIFHRDVLSDVSVLENILKKISPVCIIHLASHGAYPTQTDWGRMVQTNIQGLKNLLDASMSLPYRQFLVAGSSSEYGYRNTAMKETDPIRPNSLYAVTKAAATHLALYHAETYKKPVNVFRLFNIYGPWEEEGRLVRHVVERALECEPIALATGKEVRDFVYAEDIADAFLLALKTGPTLRGELLNLGTGHETSIYRLAQLAVRLCRSTSPIIRGAYPVRSWDAYHWKADTRKAARVLGWKAQTSLVDGLKKTIEWYRGRK